MSKAVVILGAGASADFGIPTLGGIFKDVSVLRYLKQDKVLLSQLEETFWKPRGHDLRTAGESLTVEEMLTILRDWEQADCKAKPSKEELFKFKRSLYILIQKAVYDGKSSRAACLNPLIQFLKENTELTTWASFNWDCVFEASYWYSGSGHLGDGRRVGSNPKLAIEIEGWKSYVERDELLKLHGSIGWWMIKDQLTYLSFSAGGPLAKQWAQYEKSPEMADFPVILEPSAYKYQDEVYRILEPQWNVFISRLLDADFIVIVGYSLPDLDSQARSKILTGFQANDRARWIIVDPSPIVLQKYQRLLGQRRVTTFEKTLTGFNNELQENMMMGLTGAPF